MLTRCFGSNAGSVDQVPLQVVPRGIQSVNGSDTNMGCTEPFGTLLGGVMSCGNFANIGISYLVDGKSPVINTSTSTWASQLVTMNRRAASPDDHVVLTFEFNPPVVLTSIVLDLFLCPEWKIGSHGIMVFADNNPVFNLSTATLIQNYTNAIESCDSLSTVPIPLPEKFRDTIYYIWYIVFTFSDQSDLEWVHVSEVRFVDVIEPEPSVNSS